MFLIPRNVIEFLEKNRIAFSENDDVSSRTTFKVGGRAALCVFPDSREKLILTLDILSNEGVRFEVLGNASNVLLAFDMFEGALVFTSGISSVSFDTEKVDAACGVPLTYLSDLASKRGLSGLEFAYGIPALVGGAVYMNAGAYGSCISDVLTTSYAYDILNKKTLVLSSNQHKFDYRKSVYMENKDLICLGATFSLKSGNQEEIREKMLENMRSRRDKQPLKYPSAGSYFKRPEGHFAGKLIEDCGLKGFSIGGAQVSEKHAGFIINTGGATADDILALEEKIKEKVMSEFGVMLEREVRLIK